MLEAVLQQVEAEGECGVFREQHLEFLARLKYIFLVVSQSNKRLSASGQPSRKYSRLSKHCRVYSNNFMDYFELGLEDIQRL